jgi:hypothetical protein
MERPRDRSPSNCDYVTAVLSWLREHGSEWIGRPLPDRYRHLLGDEARCFENAYQAATAEPTLSYTEGVEWTRNVEGHGTALKHAANAWLTDCDDGVVDVSPDPAGGTTIHNHRIYLGVAIPLQLVGDTRTASAGPVLPTLIAVSWTPEQGLAVDQPQGTP